MNYKFDEAMETLRSMGYYPMLWHEDDAIQVAKDNGIELDDLDVSTAISELVDGGYYTQLGNELLEDIIINIHQ